MSRRRSRRRSPRLPVRSDNTSDNQEVTVQREEHLFSGPLPAPDVLRGYDDILPGAAERIIRMAEKERSDEYPRNRSARAPGNGIRQQTRADHRWDRRRGGSRYGSLSRLPRTLDRGGHSRGDDGCRPGDSIRHRSALLQLLTTSLPGGSRRLGSRRERARGEVVGFAGTWVR